MRYVRVVHIQIAIGDRIVRRADSRAVNFLKDLRFDEPGVCASALCRLERAIL